MHSENTKSPKTAPKTRRVLVLRVFHGALIDRAILCQPHNLLAKLIGDIVGAGGRLDARDSRAAGAVRYARGGHHQSELRP
jgi:hypothetical protein